MAISGLQRDGLCDDFIGGPSPHDIAVKEVIEFIKTADQIDACDLLNMYKHILLFGGSRSGKSFICVRNIFLRAIKCPSRHLITRFRFNSAKQSLWHDTIPKVHKLCFPDLKVHYNNQDFFLEFESSKGDYSQIWLGGVDDKDRVEKILGNEYSTIFANECSQISYGAITKLRTRLAENTGLVNRFYYDCNPTSKKHWTYQEFIEHMFPGTSDKSLIDSVYMLMNPEGNLANLPSDYILELQALPKRDRERFLLGLFRTEVEGALWDDQMISWANNKPRDTIKKTVISLDPSTTNNPGSDECGIMVCSLDENNEGIVQADLTKKCSPKTWANIALNAYRDYNANYIVAESNQGGDMVKEVLQNVTGGRDVKIKLVHASKGKFARAEPVSVLYEQGKVAHEGELFKLEEEMTEWVASESKSSPNRIDALVWGMTDLFKLGGRVHIG